MTDTFTYTVTDGSNASSTATVTVTITGENDPPVAADVTASAFEHGPAVQVAAPYTDPDLGEELVSTGGAAVPRSAARDVMAHAERSYHP